MASKSTKDLEISIPFSDILIYHEWDWSWRLRVYHPWSQSLLQVQKSESVPVMAFRSLLLWDHISFPWKWTMFCVNSMYTGAVSALIYTKVQTLSESGRAQGSIYNNPCSKLSRRLRTRLYQPQCSDPLIWTKGVSLRAGSTSSSMLWFAMQISCQRLK